MQFWLQPEHFNQLLPSILDTPFHSCKLSILAFEWITRLELTLLSSCFVTNSREFRTQNCERKLASICGFSSNLLWSNNNDHCHREYAKGVNNRFEFPPTDSGQVLKLLNKQNKSKGAGLDKLSSRLIRECADLISPYISIIFNGCLTTGTFPDDWKLAYAYIQAGW